MELNENELIDLVIDSLGDSMSSDTIVEGFGGDSSSGDVVRYRNGSVDTLDAKM